MIDKHKGIRHLPSGQVSRRKFMQMMSGFVALAGFGKVGVLRSFAGSEPLATSLVPGLAFDVPQELTIVQDFDADILDSQLTPSGGTATLLRHIMDGLRRPMHGGGWALHLIESIEQIDDVSYLFHLQQGVTFHNGERFDASVVAANFARYTDPAIGAPEGGEAFSANHKSCEVVDDYTVRWTTQRPLANVLSYLTGFNLMMSPRAIDELGRDVATQPIGTGPFKFVEWVPGEKLVVEANPDYWMGPPKLTKVTWRPITESATRIMELKTGRADIMTNVPLESIADLEQTGGITVVRKESNVSAYIQFNCSKPPLQDTRVRQALNYAIDREAIANGIMLGGAKPQATFLNLSHEGYDPDLAPYPYDPDRAISLLAEAGYPNGFEFTLAGPVDRYLKGKEICQAVAAQLEAIGLTVNLDLMEFGTYINRFIQKPPVFDAALIGYGHENTALWEMGSSVYSKVPLAGYMGYNNPEFDALWEEASMTFDDVRRDESCRELRRMLYDDPPFLYVVEPQVVFAMQENIHDFYLWSDMGYWLREENGCYKS